jgi:hypothetical protein
MEIIMRDSRDGTAVRLEHLYRCSGADPLHRRPRRNGEGRSTVGVAAPAVIPVTASDGDRSDHAGVTA